MIWIVALLIQHLNLLIVIDNIHLVYKLHGILIMRAYVLVKIIVMLLIMTTSELAFEVLGHFRYPVKVWGRPEIHTIRNALILHFLEVYGLPHVHLIRCNLFFDLVEILGLVNDAYFLLLLLIM